MLHTIFVFAIYAAFAFGIGFFAYIGVTGIVGCAIEVAEDMAKACNNSRNSNS